MTSELLPATRPARLGRRVRHVPKKDFAEQMRMTAQFRGRSGRSPYTSWGVQILTLLGQTQTSTVQRVCSGSDAWNLYS